MQEEDPKIDQISKNLFTCKIWKKIFISPTDQIPLLEML